MTGYGRAETATGAKKVTVEVKTLNSKQFDVLSRLPSIYREKELEIRSILLDCLERGKVEITISIDEGNTGEIAEINQELAQEYFKQISQLQKDLKLNTSPDTISTILKLPEVLQTRTERLDENEWTDLSKAIHLAAGSCDEARLEEGKKLEKDFKERIRLIEEYLAQIETFEGQRIENIRIKFRKELLNTFENQNIDENRFEQEIIYYLEKIDITEEKVRLKNHCRYFLQTLSDMNTSKGKKLNFISQEIGREINTIGSKAYDANIQKLVVQMKDELEKIKEQLYNIL